MSPSFNEIPAALRVPLFYAEFDNSRANQGPVVQEYKALLIGSKTEAGLTANVPVRVTSADQVAELAGAGSQLHGMAQAWFASNRFTSVYIMPLANAGGGVAATGVLLVSGTATEAGAVTVYIAGRKVQAAVSATDDATAVGDSLEAAINADTSLPVTAINTAGSVALTAKNKGTFGNDIDLRLNYNDEETAAGVSVAITAMASGANNPDITNAIAAMADTWYNIIAMGYNDTANLALLSAELVSRAGPLRMIDGMAFIAKRGSHGTLTTFGDSLNYKFISCPEASAEPRPSYEVAAETAAIAAYYGNIDPARPFQTLPYTWRLPKAEADRFTIEERNQLLYDGIATSYVDAGGIVRVERLITLYQVNAFDVADPSYLDVNTLLTLSYLRFDFRAMVTTKYPRHKLANDGTQFAIGQAIMTPKLFKAECVAKFRQWEAMGLVEGIDQFKNDLIVERNALDRNRLDVVLPPDLVNQLIIVATQFQFLI